MTGGVRARAHEEDLDMMVTSLGIHSYLLRRCLGIGSLLWGFLCLFLDLRAVDGRKSLERAEITLGELQMITQPVEGRMQKSSEILRPGSCKRCL